MPFGIRVEVIRVYGSGSRGVTGYSVAGYNMVPYLPTRVPK